MEQTETKRTNSLVVAAVVAVVVVSFIGIGAFARRISLAHPQESSAVQPIAKNPVEMVRPESRPGRIAAPHNCATCGIVESVRAFEVRREATGVRAIAGIAGSDTVYRVTIRMDDGSYRTISQPRAPGYAVGEKVRVIDSAVVAHG